MEENAIGSPIRSFRITPRGDFLPNKNHNIHRSTITQFMEMVREE